MRESHNAITASNALPVRMTAGRFLFKRRFAIYAHCTMKIMFRCDPALLDVLERPLLAKSALPDWLRSMAPRTASPLHQRSIRTVKQCPPFVDAMSHGFLIPLPCDVVVNKGQFSWDWSLPALQTENQPRTPLSFHVSEQLTGSPLGRAGQSAVKFNSFWTIETEPGWSVMAVHPVNRDDLPFRLVSGLVDTDSFNAVGINFPAVWTDPNFEGTLPRGMPIAQCFVVPRQTCELVCEALDADHAAAFDSVAEQIKGGPGVYRKARRQKRVVERLKESVNEPVNKRLNESLGDHLKST